MFGAPPSIEKGCQYKLQSKGFLQSSSKPRSLPSKRQAGLNMETK